MRKRVVISFSLAFAAIILVIAVFAFPRVFGKKPFADLRAEDIANVSVCLLPPDKTVVIEDYTKLVNTLNEVVIYGEDQSFTKYSGQAVIYTITFQDGTVITVNAYNPFIIIDGIGYQTKHGPCEGLSQIANELAR